MTCIVAVTDGETVVMGGDSAAVHGLRLTVRNDRKVFLRSDGKTKMEWTFGFTTSFRMGQLIQYELELPDVDEKDKEDLFGFMVTKFIPKLRDCLKSGGWAKKEAEQENGGVFVVGLLGKLFFIDGDFHVGEFSDPFVALGCGDDIAKGSLYTSRGTKDLKKRVRSALFAAQRFSAGVREPFTIIESKYTKSA